MRFNFFKFRLSLQFVKINEFIYLPVKHGGRQGNVEINNIKKNNTDKENQADNTGHFFQTHLKVISLLSDDPVLISSCCRVNPC